MTARALRIANRTLSISIAAGIALCIVQATIAGDWARATAWLVAAAWFGLCEAERRRADHAERAWVLALGRGASAYARGYRDGSNARTFHAGRD